MGNKNVILILSIICCVSILGNCYLLLHKAANEKMCAKVFDWCDDMITRRLDDQANVFQNYANYLQKIAQGEPVLDEFLGYNNAAANFAQEQFIESSQSLTYKNTRNSDNLLEWFGHIYASHLLFLNAEQLEKLDQKQVQQLASCYEKLADLLNRDQKEKSLAWFIQRDDYKNAENQQVQAQTLAVIDQINMILYGGQMS